MVRRSTNTHAQKRKRLPHLAMIKRTEPFLRADAEELEAACVRVAGNEEFYSWNQRHEDGDRRVIGFTTPEKAAAMQAWIDESEIAKRPLPKFGRTKEELEAMRETALRWGFQTGAVRRVVQAYRRKMFEEGEGPPAEYQASHTVAMYQPPGETMDVGMFLVEWAKTHHRDWFYGRRRPVNVTPNDSAPVKGEADV